MSEIILVQVAKSVFKSSNGFTFDFSSPGHLAYLKTPKGSYMINRDCLDADLRGTSTCRRYIGTVPGDKHEYGNRWDVCLSVMKRTAVLTWSKSVR